MITTFDEILIDLAKTLPKDQMWKVDIYVENADTEEAKKILRDIQEFVITNGKGVM